MRRRYQRQGQLRCFYNFNKFNLDPSWRSQRQPLYPELRQRVRRLHEQSEPDHYGFWNSRCYDLSSELFCCGVHHHWSGFAGVFESWQ